MRVDPDDLGTVSVQIGPDGPWLSVPCTTPGMDDVTLQTWTLSLADIRARFGPGRMRSDVIQETNRAIENLSTAARHRAGLAPPTLTQEQLDHAEMNLALGMQVPRIDPAEGDRPPISANDLFDDAIETGAALGDADPLPDEHLDAAAPPETTPHPKPIARDPSDRDDPELPPSDQTWSFE